MFGGNILLQIFLYINVFVLGGIVALAISHARAHKQSKQPEKKTLDMPALPHDVRQRLIDEAEQDYEEVVKKTAAEFERDLTTTTGHMSEQLSRISDDILNEEMTRYKASLEQLRDKTEQTLGNASAEVSSHQAEIQSKLAERQAIMDQQLIEHQQELEAKLAERSTELEREFSELRADYTRKQAALEAELAQREAELMSGLRARQSELAEHQAALEAELTTRQQAHLAKQQELEARLEAELAKRQAALTAQLDTQLGDTVMTFLTTTLGQQVDLGAQTPYLLSQLEAHKAELLEEIHRG